MNLRQASKLNLAFALELRLRSAPGVKFPMAPRAWFEKKGAQVPDELFAAIWS